MSKVDYEIVPAAEQDLAAFRNKAISHCSEKYIVFADPGMTIDPEMGEILMEELERSGAGMASCGYDIIDPDTGEPYYATPEFNRRVLEKEDMLCRLFYQTHYQGSVGNKMFRTGTLKRRRIRFDSDLPGSEDMPFLVKYLCVTHSAVMLPEHLCHIVTPQEADLELEIEAYYRMKKKLWRHPDPRWLCEQSIEFLEMELTDE